ncbi:hypothetical protein [Halomonas sp. MCCC 1A11062]|uniref:hypothetical protein n=1 Tax=Halomonas sp. MCCC 1A11062 TaxID=2733485 RepID=UPI001F227CB2|nr:hypothetical protein [Halomonas sp. MCCC 1A11062]MCE8039286.1 hypothetical protein [Halomonas sp. MCCC 1A11062]
MKIENTTVIRISNSCKEFGSSPRDRQNQEGVGVRGNIHNWIRNGYYIFGLLHLAAVHHEHLMKLAADTFSRMI